jgi:hypothetical protein
VPKMACPDAVGTDSMVDRPVTSMLYSDRVKLRSSFLTRTLLEDLRCKIRNCKGQGVCCTILKLAMF